tara:strand:- start:34332 stop:34784 length:453 start_codon:yes stop_codon:yes gene_type:complete
MKKLKLSNWMEHPWSQTGMVEEVSTQFLKEISNPEAKPFTDDLDGFIKEQSVVFDSIEENGMRDPLLIVISLKNKTIRLESGNHRIDEAIKREYTHLPVATLIIQEKLIYEGNGLQAIPAEDLVKFEDLAPNPYPYQMKLSKIMKINVLR